jgi:hypothetical protein
MMRIAMTTCALALPLALVSGSAYASDAKTYPGTTCRAPEAAQSLYFARSYNKSNDTVAFSCPAVKDDHSLNWLRGHVYVSGWYRLGPGRLFVSAGIGSSVIRLRAGRRTAPEVALLEVS